MAVLLAPTSAYGKGATKARPKTVRGFAVTMKGATNNRYKVYIAREMVRIQNTITGCSIVSKGPEWRVSIWHDRTKQICYASFKEWTERQLWPYSWPAELGKPLRVTHYVANGLKHTLHHYGTTLIVDPLFRSDMGKYRDKVEKNHAEIDCIECPLAPKSGAVVGRVQGLPALPGFPVSAIRVRASGKREHALTLMSDWSQSDIDQSFFEIPPGYKTVPFTMHFVHGELRSEDMSEFAKHMWR